MEDKNNPIYIIDNQNEKNVDQILDINNDNINEFDKLKKGDSTEANLLKEDNKQMGYVRILRKIFKKKDDSRKDIIKKLFKEWRINTLKGLTIKKTVIIRISVSRDKEQRNKNKLNLEKDKNKSKSENKNDFNLLNKIQNISRNINSLDTDENNQVNLKSIDYIINENKNNDNIGHYDIWKRIKKDKGQLNDSSNNSISINLNNSNIINNEKPKSKINNNVEIKKIYPFNNTNNNNIEISRYSYKSKYNNNNSNFMNNTNSRYLQNNYKKDLRKIPHSKYNNVGMLYYSTNKNNIKDNLNNSITNIINRSNRSYLINNSRPTINITNYFSNDNNISKSFLSNYEGYNNNKSINTTLPFKDDDHIDVTSINQKINKYSLYEPKINMTNNRNEPIKNNLSFGSTNYNSNSNYKTSTYQVNKNDVNYLNNINNSTQINRRIPRRENYSLYSQKTSNPALKNGVTTVVQHYSGRRKQYSQYDKKTYITNK